MQTWQREKSLGIQLNQTRPNKNENGDPFDLDGEPAMKRIRLEDLPPPAPAASMESDTVGYFAITAADETDACVCCTLCPEMFALQNSLDMHYR